MFYNQVRATSTLVFLPNEYTPSEGMTICPLYPVNKPYSGSCYFVRILFVDDTSSLSVSWQGGSCPAFDEITPEGKSEERKIISNQVPHLQEVVFCTRTMVLALNAMPRLGSAL